MGAKIRVQNGGKERPHLKKIKSLCNTCQQQIIFYGPFRPIFLLYFCVLTVSIKYVHFTTLPMTGFKPQTWHWKQPPCQLSRDYYAALEISVSDCNFC